MISKPLELAHDFLRDVICVGDSVVDATVGNGYDTLFLAERVGAAGRVVGFDLQQQAIDVTTEKLQQSGFAERCALYAEGHENLSARVSGGVKAVVLNLGYLPGADKSVITREATTIQALEQACGVLLLEGLITVMCYPGHTGGDVESREVTGWASRLPRKQWQVFRYNTLNTMQDRSPFLIVIQRLV